LVNTEKDCHHLSFSIHHESVYVWLTCGWNAPLYYGSNELNVGEVCYLRRDIDNPYDGNAVHRIPNGPKTNGSVPVIAKFTKFKDKQEVMKNAYNLKGSGIFVHDDYCKNTRTIQKKLRDKKRELANTVAKAKIVYKQLNTTDLHGTKVTWIVDKEGEVVVK